MANLTAKIDLNTANNSSELFSFQLTKLLSIKNPSVQTFAVTVAHDADTAVLDGTENAEATYLWIYNRDATNYVKIELATVAVLRVGPGEAQLLCIEPSKAVDLRADTADCKVEYGYFTLDRY